MNSFVFDLLGKPYATLNTLIVKQGRGVVKFNGVISSNADTSALRFVTGPASRLRGNRNMRESRDL